MSKTALRKVINNFEAPELRELLLDVYAKSKEAREILDFYAEPDVKKKTEQYRQLIIKEAMRYTRHAHRPRMVKIRSILKKFRTLEPGPEAVADLMVYTIECLIEVGHNDWLSDSTYGGIDKFVGETVDFLSQYGLLELHAPVLRKSGSKITRIGIYKNPLTNIFNSHMERIDSLME